MLSKLYLTKVYRWATRCLVAWAHFYHVGVFAWVVVHFLYGDRWWWLFLLNSFAVYLFVPLPLLLVQALLIRRRELWIGLVVALALGAHLYGGLLLPKFPSTDTSGSTITVMTSNILGFNNRTEGVVAALRASRADVVALQELNPEAAELIQRDLTDEYPYQILNPQPGVAGMGVVSRYPLHPADTTLPGQWSFPPQVLVLTLSDQTITLINFHAVPPGGYAPAVLNRTMRERKQQARQLAAFAAATPGPLIALGDLNAADRSTAYAIVTGTLLDAWRAAGWGLGHTYTLHGAASNDSSRPGIAGIPVPMWLVRLDYIFYSDHWQPAIAWIGPWDGISDHRPVVAKLTLTNDTNGIR